MNLLRRLFEALRGRHPRDPSPRCAICGRPAATIELTEKAGTWILRYNGPGGSNGGGDRISGGRADAIRAAFTPPYDAAKIRAAGFHDVAGLCDECGTFYCPVHWSLSSTGAGCCPNGHRKSLDPHWSPD